jgi:hypothetical protein
MIEIFMGISMFLGFIISYLYEKFSANWHGKDIKMWLFIVLCFLSGGITAYISGDLKFEPLMWSEPELVFISVGNILKWATTICASGFIAFKTVIKKKNTLEIDWDAVLTEDED